MNVSAEYALRNAVASMEIEGFEISEDEKQLFFDFANNRLSREQFITLVLERCGA